MMDLVSFESSYPVMGVESPSLGLSFISMNLFVLLIVHFFKAFLFPF